MIVEHGPHEPDVLASARKHGISELDSQHAYRNSMDAFEVGEDMTMLIGPARDGTVLEVGVVKASDQPGHVLIVHAMRARAKFLPKR